MPGQRPPYVNRIPGQVVSCAKIRYSWEVFVDDMIVVLLSDGSLWYYRYETDLFKVLAYPLSGIFLGILAAFLVSARQKQPPFVQDH